MKRTTVLRSALFAFSAAAAFAVPQSVCAQPVPAPSATPAPLPRYHLLSDQDDWRYFCDKAHRTAAWETIKCVPLDTNAADYVSFGIDARAKYEDYVDQGFDPRQGANGYLLQRYLVHADLHAARLRTYVEFEQSTASGHHDAQDLLDGTTADLTSEYAEYEIGGTTGSTTPPVSIRYGRQELSYGDGRILDPREGLNSRQAFDGAFARIRTDGWQTDVFAVDPVTIEPGAFNDITDRTTHLWGAYATHANRNGAFDLYYVGQRAATVIYDRGAGREIRHTIGVRSQGRAGRFDGDVEGDWQFGTFEQFGRVGAAPIDAWSIAGTTGYTIPIERDALRLGIDAGIGTGDHGTPGTTLTAFRPPYPTGLTFGLIRANGPENVSGYALTQAYTHRALTLTTKEFVYERQSLTDGIYIPAGFPLIPAGTSGAARIGEAGFISAAYAVDRHLTVNTAFARYLIGGYLEDVGPAPGVASASTTYFTVWTQLKI